MHVLSIANHFPPGYTGGAEVANYNSCRGLIERGLNVSVLAINHRDPRVCDERYELDGIPVRRVNVRPARRRSAVADLFDPRLYRVTVEALRRHRPDLVHIHNVSGMTFAPVLACRRLGIPVVATLHDLWMLCPNNMRYRSDRSFCSPAAHPNGCGDCFRRYDYWADVPRRREVIARFMEGVRAFIAPSHAVIDRHVEAGFDRERFRMVRHGLRPIPPSQTAASPLSAFIATRGQQPTVVFAGGGVEIKGAEVVADALPLMLRQVEGLRVIIVGGGEPHLLQRFESHAPAVTVIGRLPFQEMSTLYGLGDLTLMPSICHEALGLVIYESYQMGTPVVATDFGGMAEIVDDGRSGYLFPMGDAAALADRVIGHFARCAVTRRQMRSYAYNKVQEELSLERHIDGVLQVYDEVLAR